MLAPSLASVSISVTNVLAVETSERMVHRRCHRALMARMAEALILDARESGREVKIIR